MKRMKKFLAFVLAMIMCLGMAVTAFAEEGKGTITISNATKEESYIAYKIFDADPATTGTAIAYTATEAQMKYWTGEATEEGSLNALVNPFTFTLNHVGTYNVGIKEEYVNKDKDVTDILNNTFYKEIADGTETKKVLDTEIIRSLIEQGVITQEAGAEAGETGAVELEVPYGYYLITSTLGAVVTVNSTQPNVSVIDKNQKGPQWPEDGGKVFLQAGEAGKPDTVILGNDGKPVTSNSAKIGDTLKFRVSVDATNYVGEDFVKEYFIKDTIGTGMEYIGTGEGDAFKATVTVKVGNTILQPTNYTLTMNGKNEFVVKIDWAKYVTSVVDGKTVDTLSEFNYPGATNTIVIEYQAKVTENANMAAPGNKNTAAFAYNTGATGTSTPENPTFNTTTSETTTYTYALGIQKVDGNRNALAGAEFIVSYKDDQNKTQYILVKTDNNGQPVKAQDGSYIYAGVTEVKDSASKLTTDTSKGQIVIKGVGEGTYDVTETKAPAGYNLATGAVSVKAELNTVSSYTTSVTTYFDKDGNVVDTEVTDGKTETYIFPVNITSATVVNKAGSLLPSTGGIGTTIFYVVGGLLAAGAGVLLITKKRMRKEQ